jgi:hypothetical protein
MISRCGRLEDVSAGYGFRRTATLNEGTPGPGRGYEDGRVYAGSTRAVRSDLALLPPSPRSLAEAPRIVKTLKFREAIQKTS